MTLPRRLALMIVIVILSSTAASARAGEYAVYSCHPAVGNVNHAWNPSSNHGGMLAYANCASTDARTWNVGLVTRPTTVPGNAAATVPTGVQAGMTFVAPPGARLARMTYTQEWCGNGSFRSGVINDTGAWVRWGTMGFCHITDQPHYTLNLGGTSAVRIQTQCVFGPCAVGGSTLRAWATTRSVIMYVSDSTRPAVAFTGGTALHSRWLRGWADISIAASDNVGIREATVRLGGAAVDTAVKSCTYTVPAPCPRDARRVAVDTNVAADGARPLPYVVRDAAGNVAAVERTVLIDNTAPGAPIDLRSSSESRWVAMNGYGLTWRNPSRARPSPDRRRERWRSVRPAHRPKRGRVASTTL